jgi:hypothetical protein
MHLYRTIYGGDYSTHEYIRINLTQKIDESKHFPDERTDEFYTSLHVDVSINRTNGCLIGLTY